MKGLKAENHCDSSGVHEWLGWNVISPKNTQNTKETAATDKPGGVFFLMQIFG
tara:strand:- start:465 stop:623 length:159 start_codon:yes stop_codon:yes gene_type:complete